MTAEPAVAIISEERFQYSAGELHSPNQFGDDFWTRYVNTFEKITLIARVEEASLPGAGAALVTLPQVHLRRLPAFQGPAELSAKLPSVLSAISVATRDASGFILRCPNTVGLLALPFIMRRRKPIAVEVVGDPEAMFTTGVGGSASKFWRALTATANKRLFREASAVTYVTQSYLQHRYPPPPGALVGSFSDVVLNSTNFAVAPRTPSHFACSPSRLLFAGTMEQSYKGIDVLLDAVSILCRKGVPVTLRIAGAGRLEPSLHHQIERLDLGACVTMVGRLSRGQLLEEMDACDLFVLPSRTEGLPRTIIEAMARATPVIASAVGGVPELLDEDGLVQPGCPDLLATAISDLLSAPDRLCRMSARNLAAAQRFAGAEIERLRSEFYGDFRQKVERCQRAQ